MLIRFVSQNVTYYQGAFRDIRLFCLLFATAPFVVFYHPVCRLLFVCHPAISDAACRSSMDHPVYPLQNDINEH